MRALSTRLAWLPLVVMLAATACTGGCAQVRPPLPSPLDDDHPFVHVDRAILDMLTEHEDVPGLGIVVLDERGEVAFERTYADFDFERTIAVASASKIVSGLLLFTLITDGTLSLDDDVTDVLSWPEDKRGITLRHLMSFTSGLTPNPLCVHSPLRDLASCVEKMANEPLEAPPGTRFDYGSSHLHVAARMAEVKTGRAFARLFDERIKSPLGITSEDAAYFSAPRQGTGTENPLIAGGLRITTRDYQKILHVILARGVAPDGTRLVDDALFDEAAKEPFPDVVIGKSPAASIGYPSMHYGLACWLECETPADGCAVTSSPGAFGFTPWIDREHIYAGMLAMQLERSATGGGVVNVAVDLEQAVQPLIIDALTVVRAGR
jgi:D-alanyl-D-alanine-carboxypeptidase/D-alanyl-D-alanine-endopeptidase